MQPASPPKSSIAAPHTRVRTTVHPSPQAKPEYMGLYARAAPDTASNEGKLALLKAFRRQLTARRAQRRHVWAKALG